MISMSDARHLANQSSILPTPRLRTNLQMLESIKLRLGSLTPPQQYLYDALTKELETRKND